MEINSTVLDAILKSAGGTFVLALLYGAAQVVKEWRGGTASVAKEADSTRRLADLEARLQKAEENIQKLQSLGHSLRYQRDQARVYAESLELRYTHEPRKTWPPDEEDE